MKTIMMTVLLVTTLLVSACGGGDSGATTPPAPEANPADPVITTTELEGAWLNACESVGLSTYREATFTFSGNAYTATITVYTDAACTVVDDTRTRAPWSGTFIIGDALTTSSGFSAKQFDMHNTQPTSYVDYVIFSIIDGKLYLGDTEGAYDGKSVDKRPIDFNFGLFFTKG